MAFGIKQLKKVQQQKKYQGTTMSCEVILWGDDINIFRKALDLASSEQTFKIITSRSWSREELFQYWNALPSFQRSLHYGDFDYETCFYKDQIFRSFSARAKPEPLLTTEVFFTQQGKVDSVADTFLANEYLWDKIISKHMVVGIVSKVSGAVGEWIVEYGQGDTLVCSELHSSLHPQMFYDVYADKKFIPKEIMLRALSLELTPVLSLVWELDRHVFPKSQTLFFPQSLTHAWGHFILETDDTEEGENIHRQRVKVLVCISESADSAYIAEKIRLLKRVLRRFQDDFEKSIVSEEIICRLDFIGPQKMDPNALSFWSSDEYNQYFPFFCTPYSCLPLSNHSDSFGENTDASWFKRLPVQKEIMYEA